MMRVLIFATRFVPSVKAGGPPRSLANLVREVAHRYDVLVITADRDHGDRAPFVELSGDWREWMGAEVFYLNVRSLKQWRRVVRFISATEFDLILLNSVWSRAFSMIPALFALAGKLRGPIVIMPRGELEQGALAHKSWRKRLLGPAVAAVYRRVITAVGVTSESEARNASVWFPNARILTTTNSPDEMELGFPDSSHPALRIVALGRVHPTKGMQPLLRALLRVTQPIHVVWYGWADDQAYLRKCEKLVRRLPDHVRFEHRPEIPRQDIERVLHNSDLMVLLLAGENFSHAIAESLQAGCPVLATPTTPWTGSLCSGGGGIVEDRDDDRAVARVLDRWAGLSESERQASRLSARQAFDAAAAIQPPNIIDQAARTILETHGDSSGEDVSSRRAGGDEVRDG